MATELEDLKILQNAESIADAVWKRVVQWDEFAKEVVGKQMARAVDFDWGKYCRVIWPFQLWRKTPVSLLFAGSLFEAKYWLNRALARGLMQTDEIKDYAMQLSTVARQLNNFAASLKSQRKVTKAQSRSVRESNAEYIVGDWFEDFRTSLYRS